MCGFSLASAALRSVSATESVPVPRFFYVQRPWKGLLAKVRRTKRCENLQSFPSKNAYTFVPPLCFFCLFVCLFLLDVVSVKGIHILRRKSHDLSFTTVTGPLVSVAGSLQHRWDKQCTLITCSQWWPSGTCRHVSHDSRVSCSPPKPWDWLTEPLGFYRTQG